MGTSINRIDERLSVDVNERRERSITHMCARALNHISLSLSLFMNIIMHRYLERIANRVYNTLTRGIESRVLRHPRMRKRVVRAFIRTRDLPICQVLPIDLPSRCASRQNKADSFKILFLYNTSVK